MKRTLFKLFIVCFYKANAGFFLFFFFIFFGTVNDGSLISYHASLLTSILGSPEILTGVFFFWILYEAKCLVHLVRIINSEEGSFLYNLQALSMKRQVMVYGWLQVSLYAPILIYSIVAIGFALKHNNSTTAFVIALFQIAITISGSVIIYTRMNNWLKPSYKFDIGIHWPKPFFTYLLNHFVSKQKLVVGGLKIFSVILLYIVLVLNSGKNDNDSFLLFYLLILLAHFIVPFLAVQFFEKELSFSRNLPLRKTQYAFAYLLMYIVLLLPEIVYLFLYGQSLLALSDILAYYGVAIASLFFLTGVQYSEAMDRDEFMKVGFLLFFVSIFMLHSKAFLPWMGIQFAIGFLLFLTGFYKYEEPGSPLLKDKVALENAN